MHIIVTIIIIMIIIRSTEMERVHFIIYIKIVKDCQIFFNFELPSALLINMTSQ